MATLNEVLYGGPQFPSTPVNPQFVNPTPMPSGFQPDELTQAVSSMEQPQAPMADVVKPAGKSKWDDPNRWMIAAAALASPNAMQLLPLGLMAYDQLTGAQERESANVAREQTRREQDTASVVESRGANTEQTRQETRQKAETFPTDKAIKEKNLKKAELELDLAQQEYDALKKIDPTGAEMAKAKLDLAKEKVAAEKALTSARGASAAESSAGARIKNITAKAGETMQAEGDNAGVWGKGGGKGAGDSATVQSAKYYETLWKQANPKGEGETDATYNARAAKAGTDYMTKAKGKAESDAFMEYVQKGGVDISTPKAYQNAMTAFKQMRKDFGQGGEPGPASGAPPANKTLKFDKNGNPVK